MVLDTVKPLYFKVNECMERYELDGRKANNIPDDFYDVVTREFNNERLLLTLGLCLIFMMILLKPCLFLSLMITP
jgi:hypothetical protein